MPSFATLTVRELGSSVGYQRSRCFPKSWVSYFRWFLAGLDMSAHDWRNCKRQ